MYSKWAEDGRIQQRLLSSSMYLDPLNEGGLTTQCSAKGCFKIPNLGENDEHIMDAVTKYIFTVHVIPHTWEMTNLHTLKDGMKVNIEVDMMAKYVERICKAYAQNQTFTAK